MIDDDSGVPLPPTPASEIEEARLAYGAVATADLRKRHPQQFEPSIQLLFRQLIEAELAAERSRTVSRLAANDKELRLHCRYQALAAERNVEVARRKVERALAYFGFGHITDEMMRLAKDDYRQSPNSLGNYVADHSPVLREALK